MKDVFIALSHVHDAGYTYNNLKMENIMLDKYNNAFLIDFGFAKKFTDENSKHLESPEKMR